MSVPKEFYEELRRRAKFCLAYVRTYKLHKGCSICGYNKCVDALVFHHTDDKADTISKIAARGNIKKLLKEMKRCIILCANCHRELHAAERKVQNTLS